MGPIIGAVTEQSVRILLEVGLARSNGVLAYELRGWH